MKTEIVPPSARIEMLLRAERALVPAPDDLRDRVIQRARAELTKPLPSPPGFLGERHLVAHAAAAGLIGIAIAGVTYAFFPRGLPGPAPSERTPTSEPTGAVIALEPPRALEVPATAAVTPVATSVPSSAPHEQGPLDEVRLLERARQAVARHDFSSAMASLAAHQRQFPMSRLSEERAALRITALMGQQRREEARAAAGEFCRRFPHSVLKPRMEGISTSP